MSTTYRSLWQTWSLVSPTPPPPKHASSSAPCASAASAEARGNVRERLQRTRIEKRLSISALAAQSRCDVELLAAFERGEDLLSADVLRRVEAALAA